MKTNEIPPKTIISVLAAQIREDAQLVAKTIVEKAKENDTDYSFLIQRYILKSDEKNVIKMSDFANSAFAEIKNTDMLLSFEVQTTHKWKFDKETKTFEKIYGGEIDIRAELDHVESHGKYTYGSSVFESGNNLYSLFKAFKAKLESKINDIKGEITDIEVAPAPETE